MATSMDAAIGFVLVGEPVAQPRVKAMRRGKFIHFYTPDKKGALKRFKAGVAQAAAAQMEGRLPWDQPVGCSIVFVSTTPECRLDGPTYKGTKPDLDNLAKSVLDSMSGIVFRDDARVSVLLLFKEYGLCPKVIVTCWPLPAKENIDIVEKPSPKTCRRTPSGLHSLPSTASQTLSRLRSSVECLPDPRLTAWVEGLSITSVVSRTTSK